MVGNRSPLEGGQMVSMLAAFGRFSMQIKTCLPVNLRVCTGRGRIHLQIFFRTDGVVIIDG